MNTRNEEDIPTRNFKKKKNNKNILNWRQTTFHMEQKQKQKQKKERKKNKQKNKEKKNEKQQQKKKKNPNETSRKIFKYSRRTNFWKTKWTWNFFQQNIIFQHFFTSQLAK